MSKIKSFLNFIAAWFVVRTPLLEHSSLSGRLRNCYRTNGVMRFAVGQELEVKNQYLFGYGIRPTAKVIGYGKGTLFDAKEELYEMEMTSDSHGSYHRWADTGWIPEDVQRVTERQFHTKWNIEHGFCAVKKGEKAKLPIPNLRLVAV
jgi:hypothetical protein